MQAIMKENIIKNLVVIALLVILFFPTQRYINTSELVSDKASAGDILVAVSIFAVIACFGNFAFTYEKINLKSKFQRYLAHITTGLLMFIIGISMILTALLIPIIMGGFFVVELTLTALYIACIGYDFWDLFRI